MSLSHSPNQNHLLAALPAAEFGRLAPHLELVPMLLGESLYEPGSQLQHVYFPTTAIVSLLYISWNLAHRPESQAWATKAYSVFLCSWE